MAYIIGGLIFFWFLIFAFRAVASMVRAGRINFKKGATRRDRVKFAVTLGAVLAFIIAVETYAPSLPLTGLTRPQGQKETPSFAATLPRYDQPVTYQDLADALPWMGAFGIADEDEVRASLEKTLANRRGRLAEKKAKLAEAGELTYLNLHDLRMAKSFEAEIAGLEAAITQIPDVLANGDVTRAKAQLSAKEAVMPIIDAELKEVIKNRLDAEKAVKAYLDAHQEEDRRESAEYRQLQVKVQSFQYQSMGLQSLRTRTRGQLADQRALADSFTADQVIPQFSGPLEFVSLQRNRLLSTSPMTAPVTPRTLLSSVRTVERAFMGKQDRPRRTAESYRCYFDVLDDKGDAAPGWFCEASMVLGIAYDLSAAECHGGDLAQACVERWVHPYINIIFRPDRITVFQPKPTDGTPAQISEWAVRFNGEVKPLIGQVDFAWDGTSDVYGNLHLIHSARDEARTPRWWRIFDQARRSYGTPALLAPDGALAANDFDSHEVPVGAPYVTSGTGTSKYVLDATDRPKFDETGNLPFALRDTIPLLRRDFGNLLGSVRPKTTLQPVICPAQKTFPVGVPVKLNREDQVRRIRAQMTGDNCESHRFVYALLSAIGSTYANADALIVRELR
jgi:hypothetical protein